jgi:hypothetical protein
MGAWRRPRGVRLLPEQVLDRASIKKEDDAKTYKDITLTIFERDKIKTERYK